MADFEEAPVATEEGFEATEGGFEEEAAEGFEEEEGFAPEEDKEAEIKLFGKWTFDDVEIRDISLEVSMSLILSLDIQYLLQLVKCRRFRQASFKLSNETAVYTRDVNPQNSFLCPFINILHPIQ